MSCEEDIKIFGNAAFHFYRAVVRENTEPPYLDSHLC